MGVRAKPVFKNLLYISSVPDKWKPREQMVEWMAGNVKHVVVLCNRDTPELAAGIPGVDYWHLPVKDSHKTVDPRIPNEVVPKVVQWIHAGEPTLVACLAGRSRSGMTCALVLRELNDWTGEQALEELRRRRPKAIKRLGPESWLRSLPTPRDEAAHANR